MTRSGRLLCPLILLLVLSLGLAGALSSAAAAAVPSTDRAAGTTIAVLYFDYSGHDQALEALKKGLAQMLITDLSRLTRSGSSSAIGSGGARRAEAHQERQARCWDHGADREAPRRTLPSAG